MNRGTSFYFPIVLALGFLFLVLFGSPWTSNKAHHDTPVTPEMRESSGPKLASAVLPEFASELLPEFAVRTDNESMPIDKEGTLWDGRIEVTWPNAGEDQAPLVRLRITNADGNADWRQLGYHKSVVSIADPILLTEEIPFGMCRGGIWWARIAIERDGDERSAMLRLYPDLDRPHVVQALLEATASYKVSAMRDQEVYNAFADTGSDTHGVWAFRLCETQWRNGPCTERSSFGGF